MYFSIIIRSFVLATLLVVKTMLFYERCMQSIEISVLSLSLDDSRTTRDECLGRTQWSSPVIRVLRRNEFPHAQTLSRKYQVIQCRQDINSMGT